MEKIGICAFSQTSVESDKWYQRFQEMAFEVVKDLLEQTSLDFSDSGIEMTISVSDDVFDARTISDNAMTDVLGAHYRCEEKVAQEGLQAIYYACSVINSGIADVVMVVGHCKESQAKSRNMVTHMAFDPFYARPVGLDFQIAAALQAQTFLDRANIGEDELAQIVVRARERGSKNVLYPNLTPVSVEEVIASKYLAKPIRELHAYPVSDGAVGFILASEKKAKEICKDPVWVTGVGCSMDTYFPGNGDLINLGSLKKAVSRTLDRANTSLDSIDIYEFSDQYAYQLPLYLTNLGFCNLEDVSSFIKNGGLDEKNINLSGGMLIGAPLILGGLFRVVEAIKQLKGISENQIQDPKTAIVQSSMGPAAQFNSAVVLSRDN